MWILNAGKRETDAHPGHKTRCGRARRKLCMICGSLPADLSLKTPDPDGKALLSLTKNKGLHRGWSPIRYSEQPPAAAVAYENS